MDQKRAPKPGQNPAQALLLNVFNDAVNLAGRYKESEMLQNYLRRRLPIVVAAGVLIAVASIACTAGTVLYLAGTRSFLLLLAMLLIPFVLLGSLFVQAYVFLSWLEGRAFKQAHPQHQDAPAGALGLLLRKHLRVDMRPVPPVPWVLAAIVFLLPLFLFFLLTPKWGVLLVLLLVLAPIGYAVLDR